MIPKDAVLPILQGPLRGKRWIVGSAIYRLWLGSYEPEKMLMAAQLLRPGDTAFDIGANVGIYTLLFSQLVGPTGYVVSFEPGPINIDYLRNHLSLNNVSNAAIVNAAVSDVSGTANFDVAGDSSTGHLAPDGALAVQVVSVDDYVADSGRRPQLLKIDVEGAEAKVLNGARGTLEGCRPIVLLATHSDTLESKCVEMLTTWRYSIRAIPARSQVRSDELIAEPIVSRV
jgi:FkbM family methyltransferase